MEDETDIIMETLKSTWQQVCALVEDTLQRWHLRQAWLAARRYSAENPLTAMLALTTALLCAFPLVCFAAFSVCTFVLTFTGFIFIEGFLLTCAGVLLGGALFVAGSLAVCLCFVAVSVYVAFRASRRLADAAVHYASSKLKTARADPRVLSEFTADQQRHLLANSMLTEDKSK